MSSEVNGSNVDFGAGSSRQNLPGTSGGRFKDEIEEIRRKIEVAEKSNKFDKCLELCGRKPDLKEFMLLKAKFLVLMNRSDEANEILCEIFKEDPQNATAISILGLIFYHQGNLKKSVEVFENALQIDPMLSHTKDVKAKAVALMTILENSKKTFLNFDQKFYQNLPFSSD